MGKKLYVGNLSYDTTDAMLEQMFAEYGTVQSAQVIMDRDAGRSKGFGFVEMGSDQEAQAAIAGLSGTAPRRLKLGTFVGGLGDPGDRPNSGVHRRNRPARHRRRGLRVRRPGPRGAWPR